MYLQRHIPIPSMQTLHHNTPSPHTHTHTHTSVTSVPIYYEELTRGRWNAVWKHSMFSHLYDGRLDDTVKTIRILLFPGHAEPRLHNKECFYWMRNDLVTALKRPFFPFSA